MTDTKKGFSLIELLLVIIIILILFLASKNLFQTPNKYLIDSEACINKINGQITQFFYQGVTGKDKIINSVTYEPNTYNIQIKQLAGISTIGLYISTGGNTYTRDSEIIIATTGSNMVGCNTNIYTVILTGQDIQSDGVSIIINKNLDNSLGNAGMKICKNYSTTNPTVCNQTTIPFSTKIDFLVCKKTGGNIDTNTCKHTYSTRFDTATQSIKSNRCLNVLYDQPCRKWSVDNF